ncbi:SDR family oxidoreductase [Streptomyces ardesiacus]|uniref:SDR family oxidoreductase n=1 Tax=Streptomyces ardesiacus TaxID=285564 RepID=UPI00380DE4BD
MANDDEFAVRRFCVGHANCRRLAADGAHVVVVDIDDPVDAVSVLTGGGDKLGLVCGISEPSQVDAVTGTAHDRYGRCDILVDNAGVFPFTDLEHMSIGLWRKVQAVNVGPILPFTRAFAPGMRAAGRGRVVHTGFLGRARPGGPTTGVPFACVTALQTIKRQSVAADLGNALGLPVSDDADFITRRILHGDGGMTRTGA